MRTEEVGRYHMNTHMVMVLLVTVSSRKSRYKES